MNAAPVIRSLAGTLGTLIVSVLPVLALEVGTGDGLMITLSGTGQITRLSADRSELLSPGKVGGFLLGEYRLNPGPELVENGGFEAPGGFRMGGGWHRDTTAAHSGKASLALKVPEKGEFLIHVPFKPDAVYLITFYIKSEDLEGTPTLHLRRLAVPMDRPSVYRMWYDGEGDYTVCLDFGLSPHTKKFPGQARFALVLSQHDPRWGMRAAAEQYFAMFPQFFEVRIRPGATAQTALIAQIKGLEDFGVVYGDRHGGDVHWIKSTNDAGMYAMTYIEMK